MTVFVFPGQGAQCRGMGRGLFGVFGDLTRRAADILGFSVERLCLEDPDRVLGQTQYTQPALFVVNALTYLQALRDGKKPPDYVAGHSLGEYDALFAAGVFDFETGLRLVKKRGELMSLSRGGAMAAVIGLGEDAVAKVLERRAVTTVTIANYNSPSQLVVAGPQGDIERIAGYFEEAGGRFIPLSVSGAFHSSYMNDAARQFRECLNASSFAAPTIPVISNFLARPYEPEAIRDTLVSQITNPVRWTECIRYLMGQGEQEFVEIGPGNVLTRLVEAITRDARPLALAAPKPSRVHSSSAGAGVKEPTSSRRRITAESLGDAQFKRDYGLTYAYLTGSMYRGVASVEMVVRVARAGMLGFFGSGGLTLAEIERAVVALEERLHGDCVWGVNFLHHPDDPAAEEAVVDLLIEHRVRVVEASAFMGITPALVRFRAHGLRRGRDGRVETENRVVGKVSRTDVAEAFLSPAPPSLVATLVAQGRLSEEEGRLLREIPMADDLCAEADSGGHTDGAVAYALTPAMLAVRDELKKRHGYTQRVRIGAAGGIGTPEAAAAAFILGAEFILTGSINHCTVEAATSDAAKDLLQQMDVQDTDYAPAGDMFELGAKVQVLKRGLFFAARANRMHELYRLHESLDEVDPKTRALLERYFGRAIGEVYEEVKAHHPPREIAKAEENPKHKMALIFRWYLARSSQLALQGHPESKVDYQIHCGPALGAFNRWIKGTHLEDWRNRHVDEIGLKLMAETAEVLNRRFESLAGAG